MTDHVTTFRLKVGTKKQLVGADVEKMVKTLNRYVDLVEISGIGESVGITSIDVRLSDKPD